MVFDRCFKKDGRLLFQVIEKRSPILNDNTERVRVIPQSTTSKPDFEIEVFKNDIGHIPFLIRYMSRLSVTSIVRKLKQESAVAIWQKR